MPTFWLGMAAFWAASWNLAHQPPGTLPVPWYLAALGVAVAFACCFAVMGSFGLLLGVWYRGRD